MKDKRFDIEAVYTLSKKGITYSDDYEKRKGELRLKKNALNVFEENYYSPEEILDFAVAAAIELKYAHINIDGFDLNKIIDSAHGWITVDSFAEDEEHTED